MKLLRVVAGNKGDWTRSFWLQMFWDFTFFPKIPFSFFCHSELKSQEKCLHCKIRLKEYLFHIQKQGIFSRKHITNVSPGQMKDKNVAVSHQPELRRKRSPLFCQPRLILTHSPWAILTRLLRPCRTNSECRSAPSSRDQKHLLTWNITRQPPSVRHHWTAARRRGSQKASRQGVNTGDWIHTQRENFPKLCSVAQTEAGLVLGSAGPERASTLSDDVPPSSSRDNATTNTENARGGGSIVYSFQ